MSGRTQPLWAPATLSPPEDPSLPQDEGSSPFPRLPFLSADQLSPCAPDPRADQKCRAFPSTPLPLSRPCLSLCPSPSLWRISPKCIPRAVTSSTSCLAPAILELQCSFGAPSHVSQFTFQFAGTASTAPGSILGSPLLLDVLPSPPPRTPGPSSTRQAVEWWRRGSQSINQLTPHFCLNPPIADSSGQKKFKFPPLPAGTQVQPTSSSIYGAQTVCRALIWELAIGRHQGAKSQNSSPPRTCLWGGENTISQHTK